MVRLKAVSLLAGLVMAWGSVSAAPTFAGLKEARPAPGAAVLRWDRAQPGAKNATITYRIYKKEGRGWNFAKPVAEMRGTEWAVTGLSPNADHDFIVRASDSTGTEKNSRSVKVRPTGALPSEEWRAVWFTRFEWAGGDRAAIQSRIRSAMTSLAQGNFNAVIFQVRGQGDTLYPSPDEPWSPMISADARKMDPVGFALGEARKNGLQFHAWLNLSVVWQSGTKKPPTDRKHPFFRFADASNARARAGLIHDSNGRPKQWGADDYVWLTHGNPEVNAYLRRQVMVFLEKYNVDGLHWDDRTGNPNGVSRDPVSVSRFGGRGNPMGVKDFGTWQRDQLSRFLSDVYVATKARNPKLLISGSPFGIADKNRIPGYSRFSDAKGFGVQPEQWLAQGVVDVLTPQIYWDLPDPDPNFGTVLRDWMAHNKSGRPIWPGSALGKYGAVQPLNPMQARYVAIQRSLGAGGNTFFSYSAAKPEEWRAAARSLYPSKARVPVPPHMRRPIGQVMGTITNAQGKPVTDCWVRISGRNYVYLSSADGFFGIPNVPPGNYTVSYSSRAGENRTQNVSVQPGQTTRMTLKAGSQG